MASPFYLIRFETRKISKMDQTINIKLKKKIKQALEEYSRQAGISQDEVVSEALRQHFFLRRFRSLREKLVSQAEKQGIVSDEDVFDRIS